MKNHNSFFVKYHKPAIISEADSGKIIEVNEQVLQLFNKSNEEFFNLKRSDIFPQKALKDLDKQI
ncbi:MAG: hypothetical protein EHM47_07430, partial [Ignavibacteriales bacterium]